MKRSPLIIPMLLTLALASVLGAVFNNASPLGLHAPEPPPAWTNSVAPANAPRSNVVQVVAPVTNAPVVPPAPQTNPPPPAPVAANPPVISNVTWPQTKEILTDGRTVLVDARMPNYFEAGHIPNAVCLPATSAGDTFAAFTAKHPPPATPLIVYCGADYCHLSHALAVILTTQHGYTNVKVMNGGYAEYLQAEANKTPK